MMNKHNEIVNTFLKIDNEDFKNIAEKLINIIFNVSISLDCAVKWNQLTFTIDNDYHHWILAINITKKFVGLTFHYGGLLEDHSKIFSKGTSKFLRKIEIKNTSQINKFDITDLINQSLEKRDYFIANWKKINKQ